MCHTLQLTRNKDIVSTLAQGHCDTSLCNECSCCLRECIVFGRLEARFVAQKPVNWPKYIRYSTTLWSEFSFAKIDAIGISGKHVLQNRFHRVTTVLNWDFLSRSSCAFEDAPTTLSLGSIPVEAASVERFDAKKEWYSCMGMEPTSVKSFCVHQPPLKYFRFCTKPTSSLSTSLP